MLAIVSSSPLLVPTECRHAEDSGPLESSNGRDWYNKTHRNEQLPVPEAVPTSDINERELSKDTEERKPPASYGPYVGGGKHSPKEENENERKPTARSV